MTTALNVQFHCRRHGGVPAPAPVKAGGVLTIPCRTGCVLRVRVHDLPDPGLMHRLIEEQSGDAEDAVVVLTVAEDADASARLLRHGLPFEPRPARDLTAVGKVSPEPVRAPPAVDFFTNNVYRSPYSTDLCTRCGRRPRLSSMEVLCHECHYARRPR